MSEPSLHRHASGEGQHIDLALLANQAPNGMTSGKDNEIPEVFEHPRCKSAG